MATDLASMRRDYGQGFLEEQSLATDPFEQFRLWFQEAVDARLTEPNAMALATARDGQPTIRVVLLKGLDDTGFVFFTNYNSRKGRDITENPKVSLNFFWDGLERQVRIEGIAERVSTAESDAYFASRDRGSRVGAWSSPQSEVIRDRAVLEELVERNTNRFYGQDTIPRPDHWGGFRVVPQLMEFWQGRPSRLHDRIQFRRLEDGTWHRERLAP